MKIEDQMKSERLLKEIFIKKTELENLQDELKELQNKETCNKFSKYVGRCFFQNINGLITYKKVLGYDAELKHFECLSILDYEEHMFIENETTIQWTTMNIDAEDDELPFSEYCECKPSEFNKVLKNCISELSKTMGNGSKK